MFVLNFQMWSYLIYPTIVSTLQNWLHTLFPFYQLLTFKTGMAGVTHHFSCFLLILHNVFKGVGKELLRARQSENAMGVGLLCGNLEKRTPRSAFARRWKRHKPLMPENIGPHATWFWTQLLFSPLHIKNTQLLFLLHHEPNRTISIIVSLMG